MIIKIYLRVGDDEWLSLEPKFYHPDTEPEKMSIDS